MNKLYKIYDAANASFKVAYDKTSEYLQNYVSYYSTQDVISMDSFNEHGKDKMQDYEGVINIEIYQDETTNSRILPPVGKVQEYTTFFGKPTPVVDNIYLGSAFNAASYNTLKKLNIKLIINATSEISDYYPNDFTYFRYNLYDNNKQSIAQYLERAYNDIRNYQQTNDGNILIHCFMGASRSASIILYYLMKTHKNNDGEYLNFDEAIEFLKKKRHIINPTFRFTKDLARSMYVKQ